MRTQRCQFRVEGGSDVHKGVSILYAHHPYFADGVSFEAFSAELGMRERVPGVRVHRAQCSFTGCQMVGVTGEDSTVVPLRRLTQHARGANFADDPGEVPTQFDRRGEPSVGIAEKDHVADTDLPGGCDLLGPADRSDLPACHGRVEPAGVAVGDHAIGDRRPGRCPRRHRSGSSEIHVVRMGGDHEYSVVVHDAGT